jgi:hypothetical protein
MASDLNSVLLEGTVSGMPCVADENGEKRCSFVMSSLRGEYNRNGKLVRNYETRIRIVITSSARAKAAMENARTGRGLRVVGRLAGTAEDNNICIIAEHVAYRPEVTGKKKGERL